LQDQVVPRKDFEDHGLVHFIRRGMTGSNFEVATSGVFRSQRANGSLAASLQRPPFV
jgi:hypothetical protein